MSNTSINIEAILNTFTPEQWEMIAAYAAEKAKVKHVNGTNQVNDKTPVERRQFTEEELYAEVSDILHEIRVPANLKGHNYLREAVILAYQDWNYVEGVTKLLYPSIAKKFNTTSSRVERAIRHSIERAFDLGEIEVLNKYFIYSPNKGKPTNSETVAALAEYLKLHA